MEKDPTLAPVLSFAKKRRFSHFYPGSNANSAHFGLQNQHLKLFFRTITLLCRRDHDRHMTKN